MPTDGGGENVGAAGLCTNISSDFKISNTGIIEKWTNQIEKVFIFFSYFGIHPSRCL
jgi:hypothetical protein